MSSRQVKMSCVKTIGLGEVEGGLFKQKGTQL